MVPLFLETPIWCQGISFRFGESEEIRFVVYLQLRLPRPWEAHGLLWCLAKNCMDNPRLFGCFFAKCIWQCFYRHLIKQMYRSTSCFFYGDLLFTTVLLVHFPNEFQLYCLAQSHGYATRPYLKQSPQKSGLRKWLIIISTFPLKARPHWTPLISSRLAFRSWKLIQVQRDVLRGSSCSLWFAARLPWHMV